MFQFPDYLCLIDIETTDQSLGEPEIIEIAGLRLFPEGSRSPLYSKLVRPDLHLVSKFNLSGITVDELEGAESWMESWRDFADYTCFNKYILASWGISGDVSILKSEYKKVNIGYPHNERVFDVLSMAQTVCGWLGIEPESWKLAHVCKRLGVEITNPQHRAGSDVETLYKLVIRLIQLINTDGDPLVVVRILSL